MDYTWEEVLNEKLPQTLYSLEKLEEEAKRKKERQEEAESKADMPTPSKP